MHQIHAPRLARLLETQVTVHPATDGCGAAHDMLVMSSRPDLTSEFPERFAHPSQRSALERLRRTGSP